MKPIATVRFAGTQVGLPSSPGSACPKPVSGSLLVSQRGSGCPPRARGALPLLRTPLTCELDEFPGEIDVTLCSLDKPEAVLPKGDTSTSSSLTWVKLANGLPSYREGRQEGENSRPQRPPAGDTAPVAVLSEREQSQLGAVPLRGSALGRLAILMSTPKPVATFYERIWNAGDLQSASGLLTPDFSFRSSLGTEMRGRGAFTDYVRSIRSALSDYRCDISECVSEGEQAFAKVVFSGRHIGVLRGYQPTGKVVSWVGAALFRFRGELISSLWVLGDLAGLDAALRENQSGLTSRRS